MSTNRYQVHFLSPNATVSSRSGQAPTNRKSIEAARTEARSHAARVSHPSAARKSRISKFSKGDTESSALSPASSKDSDETSPDPGLDASELDDHPTRLGKPSTRRPTTLPILKFRLNVNKGKSGRPQRSRDEDDDPALVRRRESVFSSPPKMPREISKSALDPFVRAPLELSVPDEHLLHLYLSTVPDQIYGSSPEDVSAVIRHGTIGVVETNEIVVMWLLLVIESQVVSYQPSRRDKTLSILTRRSLVYQIMNERLRDQNVSLTDEYIFGVAGAAASEHRMGNTANALHHMKAVRNLLDLRGGLQAVRTIRYPVDLMIVNILVEQGIDDLWRTHDDLLKKAAKFSRWLQDVETWNLRLRHFHATQAAQYQDFDHHSDADSGYASSADSPINDCPGSSIRARAFARGSALFDYVKLPEGTLNVAQCRFYLSILFVLNTALYAFRDSDITSTTYVGGVNSAVEMSALHNFTLRAGGAKLPSMLLLLMIAHNAVDIGERNESTEVVFHVEEVFEFVEMVMMASSQRRMSLLRALESCLTVPLTDPGDLILMDRRELDALGREVERKWLADNILGAEAKSV